MSQVTQLPRLSRIDFFRLQEEELACALSYAAENYVNQFPDAKLSCHHQALLAWSRMSIDVPNGGFAQFFFNHRGDLGVAELAALADTVDLPKAGAVIRDALAVYRMHQAEFAVANPWDGLFGGIQEFDKLEKTFMGVLLRCNRAFEKWIRSNIAELANDELGDPIDAQFTGAVEIRQSNGLVGEYLEVKKGKPNGAYRLFFEDGTVRKVTFYKAGKVSGDFWPNGNLKRKESKRGKQTMIEWFYPGGQLQKRYVKDKDGYACEPIRLFYENGQLAEEITTVEGVKRGPWLKFFDDGSPKLRAEYLPDEKLIVHDAWDDNRTQVVTSGSGVFHNDGRGIDWQYSVYFEHRWQHDTELRNGIKNGHQTTYNDGIRWSTGHFVDGVPHGESTHYWKNGRVRSVTQFVIGEEQESESFPIFDRPVPAVVLSVEANEKLYAAWDHLKVDEFPQVLNLEEIQSQLRIPDFLQEVYERNLAGTIKSDYEDYDTFNDGIAYFLVVTEQGIVASASANGSGVYSIGQWGTYPPLLEQLRFVPGRIRGRAVECRVLACVDHTFVEGPVE